MSIRSCWLAAAFFCVASFLPGLAAGQNAIPDNPANRLVQAVVDNEIKAEQADNTRWFYISDDTERGRRQIKEVVETQGGTLTLALQQDSTPVTPAELKKEENKLEQLAHDPGQLQKRKQAASSDADKAHRLMEMLPKAFIYKEDGRDQNGYVRLTFEPNPAFNPPSREAKVFHSMAGMVVVDPKSMRLASLSGHLVHDVNFGWGILGSLRKGGTFNVTRVQVAPGIWKEGVTDVHISGHALFFHTINEQQHEMRSHYLQVDSNIAPPQAARLLIERAGEESAARMLP